ncbi:MAG: histidine kinase [Bacteroidota bacterium]|nr:histidine kinase [Bacteroidota bacterium]
MSTLRRWLFPAFFGLLIYATVRLLNDTISGFRFWERPWGLNLFEMATSVLLGYGVLAVCRRVLRHFDQAEAAEHRPPRLTREVLVVAGTTLLLVNVTFLPMAALTDDGLSWGDTATISTIPLLYTLAYYGWVRSRHFLRAYLDRQLLLERATHENVLTELKFLRAQYHPHFLFNALNTVYFQMDEDVPAAKHSLEQLSELLRYQLYDQQRPVPVAQELQYLRSYLDLQRVRSSEQLRLSVSLAPELAAQRLYPLLLLPLLENAFKYVGGAYTIDVRASLTAGSLVFEVRNAVSPAAAPAATPAAPEGIGLANLRRRLHLLYPQRHALHTALEPPYFVARLTLPLLEP